jgi:hypothetical protein
VLAIAVVAPRCSTAPPCSNHAAPHASFDLAQGCAGYYCAMTCDPGFADCNDNQGDGCETSTTSGLPPHTELDTSGASSDVGCGESAPSIGSIGQCAIVCEPGFFDCDHDKTNGCETASPIGCPIVFDASNDSSPPAATRLSSISFGAHGLVACVGGYYYFDGVYLREVDSFTLAVSDVATSPGQPVGGLACDGATLYWATAAAADAAPDTGELQAVSVLGGTPQAIATGFEPSPGIDVDDAGVLVMSTSGLLLAQDDGGLAPWMPATPTGSYKPFARGASEAWSIADASIVRRTDDAGAATWVDDAGAPSTVVLASGAPIASIHASFGDAGATTDWLALLEDDAGAPNVSPFFVTAKPIVASVSGAKAVVASDDTIYLVTPGQVTPLFQTNDHVVDVAIDGAWVVWTTRGQGSSMAGIFRGALP